MDRRPSVSATTLVRRAGGEPATVEPHHDGQTRCTHVGSPHVHGNHSSDEVRRIGCGGGGPNSVASGTPSHGSWGTGAAKRRRPTGGCAYGIPRKA